MGIKCRIIRNNKGGVSYVEAPNGNRSQLFEDAKAKYGEKRALDIVLTAYTPSYIENVKNPKIIRNRERFLNDLSNLPPMTNSVTVELADGTYSFDPQSISFTEEDLGNGETLYSFQADLSPKTGELKAPNGKKSNLNFLQWQQVRSESFMKWSNNWNDVIKDENGEPQVHYHGTPEDRFNVFDSGQGVEFFTPHIKTAEMYKGFGGVDGIYEVYIKSPKTFDPTQEIPSEIKNFLEDNLGEIERFVGEEYFDIRPRNGSTIRFEESYGKKWEEIPKMDRVLHMLSEQKTNWEILEAPIFMDFLKTQGYTGFKTLEQPDNIGIFNNRNIKSATENIGTFSSETADIRFSTGITPQLIAKAQAQQAQVQKPIAKDLLKGLSDKLKESGLAKKVNIVSESKIRKVLDNAGKVYQQGINGFVIGDTVYINQDNARLDTPIHEFGHLWNSWMQEKAPKIFERGIDLIKSDAGKSYVNLVKKTQPSLEGDAIYEEALAQAIGDNGARIAESAQKNNFKEWLAKLWRAIQGAVGLANTKLSDFQNLTLDEFAERAAIDLMSGKALDSIMNAPQGSVGEAFTLRDKAPMKYTKLRERFNFDLPFVTDIPVKSLAEVIEEYEGRFFGITSDATGTGYDSKGNPIYGGIGFMSIAQNVKDGIGFASLNEAAVIQTIGKIKKRFKAGDKVAVLVMIQNPSATLGNAHGAQYFGRGLKLLKEQKSSEEYNAIVDSIRDYIVNSASLSNEYIDKYKDAAHRESLLEAFTELMRNVDSYSEEEFAQEFLKDSTFNGRKELLKNLIPNRVDFGNDITPLTAGFREMKFTHVEFLKEFGENTIFEEQMYKEDEGGHLVGGFEFTIPESDEAIRELVASVQTKGIRHSTFNGKFPTTGQSFFLDGVYPVNENLAIFGKKESKFDEDKFPQEERDALVRKLYTRDNQYSPQYREGAKRYMPMEERGYTQLANKGKFKEYIKENRPDVLRYEEPTASTWISNNWGFSPYTEQDRLDVIEKARTGEFVRFSKGNGIIQNQVENPQAPIPPIDKISAKDFGLDLEAESQEADLPVDISEIQGVLTELNNLGHDTFMVGGAIRDVMLGQTPKDIDVEVQGMDIEELKAVLDKYGNATMVEGGNFGIITFVPEGGTKMDEAYDFSVPRVETKVAEGKAGFEIVAGKNVGKKEAFSRRENSINAVGYNPISKELYNPFGGLQDLYNKEMNKVSDAFNEDPSRIVRAMQFQARFGLKPSDELYSTMRDMVESGEVDTVPKELWGKNFEKFFKSGVDFTQFFEFLQRTGIGTRYFPELMLLKGTQQDSKWHPEGNVEEHTKQVMQKAYEIAERDGVYGDDRLVLILSALVHDIAKPQTTKVIGGNITARGHEAAGVEPAKAFMEKLKMPNDIINRVLPVVKEHLAHASIASLKTTKQKKSAFRKLQNRLESGSFKGRIQDLLWLMEADMLGRNNSESQAPESLFEMYWLKENLGDTKPVPFIQGRDLIKRGMKPGKKFGEIINKAEQLQDAQYFDSKQDADEWLDEAIEKDDFDFVKVDSKSKTQRRDARIPRSYEPKGYGLKRKKSTFREKDITEGQMTSMLMNTQWGILTAENPNAKALSEEKNAELNEKAEEWLAKRGYEVRDAVGYYGNQENSFIVPNLKLQDAVDFANEFKQESVAHSSGLVYPNGEIQPRVKREDSYGGKFSDFYSEVEVQDKTFAFSIGYADGKVDSGVRYNPKSVADKSRNPNLLTDTEGNNVFYHFSFEERDVIDPSKTGTNPRNITSREELAAINLVGGMSMYYVKPSQQEANTGKQGHMVAIPRDKVYNIDLDPDNLSEEAERRFRKEHPNKGFTKNIEAAYITKIANEKGYDMAYIEWSPNAYRAQTTKKLKPKEKQIVQGNAVVKSFTNYEDTPKFSIGFMQTRKTEGGEQISVVNTDSSVKGNGIATEMYKKIGAKLAQNGQSLISDFNNKATENIWSRLSSNGLANLKEIEGKEVMATGNTDGFDQNGEPYVEDVTKYIQSRNYEGLTLSDNEQMEVRNILLGSTMKDSQELLRKLERAFLRFGEYNPSEDTLMASGLYSRAEARALLDSQEKQLTAYEFIHKLRNSDNIENDLYVDSNYVTMDTTVNSLGLYNKTNPYINEKEAINKLGGIQDEALFESQAEAYGMEFANFWELSKKKRLTVYNEDGSPRTNLDTLRERMRETLTSPSNATVIKSANYLLEVPNNIWNTQFEDVRELLNEFEKEAIDIGLDLTNLAETAYDKTPLDVKNLLTSVRNFAVTQNSATFDILLDNYVSFFDREAMREEVVIDTPAKIEGKTLRYVETERNSVELFEEQGLLPLGNNLYQKVNNNKSLEEVVDIMYQSIQVNPQLLPKTALKSALNDGVLNRSFINNAQNEAAVKKDIREYANTESRLLDDNNYDKDTMRKMVLYSAYFNTKLTNELPRPSLENEISIMNNFPNNSTYLTSEFIADFNKKALKEKQKGSEAYRDFYSNFTVSKNGIELINSDPITMATMRPYLTDNLKNHFKLKKNSFVFERESDMDNLMSNVAERNYVANYPKSVEKFKGIYQVEDNTLTTKHVKDFIRVDEGVFEYIETVGNKSVYGRIPTNEGIFKSYDMSFELPKGGDITLSMNNSVKADKKVNNLYNGEQSNEIDNQIDNC